MARAWQRLVQSGFYEVARTLVFRTRSCHARVPANRHRLAPAAARPEALCLGRARGYGSRAGGGAPDLPLDELHAGAWQSQHSCRTFVGQSLSESVRADAQKKVAPCGRAAAAGCRGGTRAWRAGQPNLDPDRLVFIDETWTTTNMARRYGRAPRGQRLVARSRTATGRRPRSSRACGPAA